MPNETEELKREIARLQKSLNTLEQRTRFNQIAVVTALDKIDATALPRGKEAAQLLTGLEEEPQV